MKQILVSRFNVKTGNYEVVYKTLIAGHCSESVVATRPTEQEAMELVVKYAPKEKVGA